MHFFLPNPNPNRTPIPLPNHPPVGSCTRMAMVFSSCFTRRVVAFPASPSPPASYLDPSKVPSCCDGARPQKGSTQGVCRRRCRHQWNPGDLVLAKVKGYPAWPAPVALSPNGDYSPTRFQVQVDSFFMVAGTMTFVAWHVSRR